MESTKRIDKWKLLLSEYDIDLKHVSGTINIPADALSRNFKIQEIGYYNYEQIVNAQKKIKMPQNFKKLDLNGKKLWVDEKDRLVIPEIITYPVLENLHVKLGHPGGKKLYYTIRKYLHIKGLEKSIQRVCNYCIDCKTSKGGKGIPIKAQGVLFDPIPFNKLCIDIKGPIATSEIFYDDDIPKIYILVIVDMHTRICKLAIMKDLTTESVLHGIREWLRIYKKPTFILSDKGRQFVSDEYMTFLNQNGIKPITTTTENPQGNGICERVNSTITDLIRMYKGKTSKELTEILEVRLNTPTTILLNALQSSISLENLL